MRRTGGGGEVQHSSPETDLVLLPSKNPHYILCCDVSFTVCLSMNEMEKTVCTRQFEIQHRNGSQIKTEKHTRAFTMSPFICSTSCAGSASSCFPVNYPPVLQYSSYCVLAQLCCSHKSDLGKPSVPSSIILSSGKEILYLCLTFSDAKKHHPHTVSASLSDAPTVTVRQKQEVSINRGTTTGW